MSSDLQIGYLAGIATVLFVIAANPRIERWRDRWLKPRMDASANRKVQFIREAPTAEVDAMFRRWLVTGLTVYLSVVLALALTMTVAGAGWLLPVRWFLLALWAMLTVAAWQIRRVYRETNG